MIDPSVSITTEFDLVGYVCKYSVILTVSLMFVQWRISSLARLKFLGLCSNGTRKPGPLFNLGFGFQEKGAYTGLSLR